MKWQPRSVGLPGLPVGACHACVSTDPPLAMHPSTFDRYAAIVMRTTVHADSGLAAFWERKPLLSIVYIPKRKHPQPMCAVERIICSGRCAGVPG